MNVHLDYNSYLRAEALSLINMIICAWILALNSLITRPLIYITEQKRGRNGYGKNEKVKWTMLTNPLRSRSNGRQWLMVLCFVKFGSEPKIFSPVLWIFGLEKATSSCPPERGTRNTDSSLIKRVGFQGHGGDRALDQQAIILRSEGITHNWTGYMQKRTISPFQVVSTGFCGHCSVLIPFSLPLFLPVTLVMNYSFCTPTFPSPVVFWSWLTGLNPC